MAACLNIDYLQLYCLQEFDLIKSLEAQKLKYEDAPDSGRHFERKITVYLKGKEFLYIQHKPRSLKKNGGIWKENACLVRVNNYFLYHDNIIGLLLTYLFNLQLSVQSISRVDLAYDFNEFDNGDTGQTFIQKFLNSEYIKKGVKKYSLVSCQNGATQTHQYIRFGSGSSPVSVYLYDKTRELMEVHDKPHIRDAWREAGLDTSRHIWRLEFSLRSSAKYFILLDSDVNETGENTWYDNTTAELLPPDEVVKESKLRGKQERAIRINLSLLSNEDFLKELYQSLTAQYFRFVTRQSYTRRTNESINLINLADQVIYKKTKLGTLEPSPITVKRLINELNCIMLTDETDPILFSSALRILDHLKENYRLDYMTREKNTERIVIENSHTRLRREMARKNKNQFLYF